ncbi:sodium:solute symporter family protein [Bacillus thermotolerans]|uniref:Proline/sodium symporter PutP n=1 Tax=Bacillus thermotolerans TaxID=1221996 RepID=A0A0F5HRF5_BACTR|nr:sodium:solute symporter family protein [Bacillus thermotolerans]KKB33213.1 Proline/sodium symporter PutP [Bacillus thermotolerans]KKB34569.1 Proline/sodium symporter PutP [Bacillus thermotolerans]KKB35906.1 Proline/sodium symporter PutP [Bacillus thermotolerans]
MIYTIGVICSFLIYVLIGIVLSRRVKNSEEYYVSGRNGSTLMITGMLVASFLSTVSFMGEAGFSYEGYPILLLILVIFNATGYVIGVFFFGRYLRRSKSLTVPEYFGNRFQSNKIRIVTAITTIFGISAYLVAVTQGAAVLLSEISGVSYIVALLIMWLVYTSFTTLSGAKGVMVNDTIMFFIFSLATYISLPYIIQSAGGFPEAIVKAATNPERPDLLSWHGITGPNAYMGEPWEALLWAIIMGLVWSAVIAISPWQSSRYLMAKNEHVAIRSGIWATISIITIYLFLHLSISAVTTLKGDIAPTEKVFIWAAMNATPQWLGIIIVSGIMAAALSSCASFLQLIGSSITRDIMEQSRNKTYSDKQLLRASRMSMIVVSIIILLIGIWQPPSVMWIGYFAATLFAASWGPVAFASVFSKNVTETGAFWSIIMGFSGVVFGELLVTFGIELPVYFNPVIIGVILSLIALYAGSKFGEISIEERNFQTHILKRPIEPNEKEEMVITRRYPGYLMISGVVIIMLTFIFYYWPLTLAM